MLLECYYTSKSREWGFIGKKCGDYRNFVTYVDNTYNSLTQKWFQTQCSNIWQRHLLSHLEKIRYIKNAMERGARTTGQDRYPLHLSLGTKLYWKALRNWIQEPLNWEWDFDQAKHLWSVLIAKNKYLLKVCQ